MTPSQAPRRRADARRSRAAILDAALPLLNDRPEASVEAVATAAGVTRQTVYAHFPSRERLLAAVLDRLTEEAVTEMDAVDLDAGSAVDALFGLLEASARSVGRYPSLLRTIGSLPVASAHDADDAERHAPVAERLGRVIRRGQAAGEFDALLAPDWLVTVTIGLAHAAAGEVEAGRMTEAQAAGVLRTSLLRVLGVTDAAGR
ncbi:TetR/AcrR family transcriptional regulator [Streptomyces sp. NPDC050658]|uniref:TetR/AcrR family transcriptional regulator n=1 Tax=unclassified Streptomyces TaxID=2593676 RepID=UPI0034191518